MNPRPLFEFQELTIQRPGAARPELDRLSLSLHAGETVILLGEADSGKNALLRLFDGTLERGHEVSGTLRFGEGEIGPVAMKLNGTLRIASLPGAASRPLDPLVSAGAQLIRIIARKLDCPRGAAREELRAALERFPAAPSFDMLHQRAELLEPAALSWALLAAACATTPDLLLCDHPFIDLSPASARALTDALLAEQKRLGFAMIYAARGPQTVARVGGRTIVLRQGRVVEESDAARLMTGQTHAYTRLLFKALPQLQFEAPARSIARGEPLLQVHGLNLRPEAKKRGKDQLSFELRRGASLALVGEEGSGRRTLMRALLGLERRPGRILFDAVDLNLLSDTMTLRLRRRVAFVTSADDALDLRMTLWDTVDEPLRAHLGLSRDLTAGYREAALKRVGLASHDGRRTIATLSPFDRRRLLVARAIVGAPLLVVVDEPLRGLDAVAQTTMRGLLAEFRTEQQSAFLVITSDFSVAQALADEAMVFQDGRVVERGPIRNLVSAPQEPATRALLDAVTYRPLSREAAPV
jgi:peptide/nickel transport system ATP-binding protein